LTAQEAGQSRNRTLLNRAFLSDASDMPSAPLGQQSPPQRSSTRGATIRPGTREFAAGLAVLTVLAAVSAMRGGPQSGVAATPPGFSSPGPSSAAAMIPARPAQHDPAADSKDDLSSAARMRFRPIDSR
jgi:hypothetical protein